MNKNELESTILSALLKFYALTTAFVVACYGLWLGWGKIVEKGEDWKKKDNKRGYTEVYDPYNVVADWKDQT